MAKNNLTILFWLYKARANKKGEIPIYLRITHGNSRKNIATGFSINKERWDKTKDTVKGIKPDAVNINAYISQAKARLMELFNQLWKNNDIDLDILVNKFLGNDVDNRTILQLVKYHNKDFKARIGTGYTESTYEKYDILYRKLQQFIPYKYQKVDVRLRDLSVKFIVLLYFKELLC